MTSHLVWSIIRTIFFHPQSLTLKCKYTCKQSIQTCVNWYLCLFWFYNFNNTHTRISDKEQQQDWLHIYNILLNLFSFIFLNSFCLNHYDVSFSDYVSFSHHFSLLDHKVIKTFIISLMCSIFSFLIVYIDFILTQINFPLLRE